MYARGHRTVKNCSFKQWLPRFESNHCCHLVINVASPVEVWI